MNVSKSNIAFKILLNDINNSLSKEMKMKQLPSKSN